jgi:hypothetical protein
MKGVVRPERGRSAAAAGLIYYQHCSVAQGGVQA